MKTYEEFLKENMVAGDSAGNPTAIASGVTSGAVVNKGPETLRKKREKDEPKK